MKAIINGKIITQNGMLDKKAIIFDNKITDITDKKNINGSDIEIIDACGSYISSGFIDSHIHGSFGKDAMDGSIEGLKTISRTIAGNGVTSFLPTTMTMSREKIYKALDSIREAENTNLGGAQILGAHLEGPFISKKYKGAQKEDYILKPDFNFIEDYKDIIKIITFAPEEDNNFNFIKDIKNNTNIVLSIGHSNASYEEAVDSIKMGVNHITHMFNAMTPLHHRNPGVVGAALNSSVYCELIADNIHVCPAAYNILLKIKGKDKVILITDCMRAGSLKDGISELGGQTVYVKNNSARLADGTLAGSILTLNIGIKNIFENTNLSLNEAVSLATVNPAKLLNIYDKKGSLEEGKDADITIFNRNFDIMYTFVHGKMVYKYNKEGAKDESNNCK